MSSTVDLKAIMDDLIRWGYTMNQISEQLDGRVSTRTLRRWRNEDTSVKNQSNLAYLVNLHQSIKIKKGE